MRICTCTAILLAAVTLTASPALASDWSLENFKKSSGKSDWDGFGVGTSFTKSSNTTTPMGNQARDERKTIVKIEGNKITLKVESRMGGADAAWTATEVIEEAKKPATWEQTLQGEETLTIGEQEFACKKYALKKTQDAKVETIMIWESAKDGVLRIVAKPEGAPEDMDMRATKLSVDRKIGETTVKCREFSATMKTGKVTLLISTQLPEEIISMTAEMDMQGMKITTKAEVTAITLKPAAATTPSTK